jgi:hypothetical protein
MKLVKFIQFVEASGLICLLETHTKDGEVYLGIKVSTKPDPDSDSWMERSGHMIDWQPIHGGSVRSPDYAFERIKEHLLPQNAASAA